MSLPLLDKWREILWRRNIEKRERKSKYFHKNLKNYSRKNLLSETDRWLPAFEVNIYLSCLVECWKYRKVAGKGKIWNLWRTRIRQFAISKTKLLFLTSKILREINIDEFRVSKLSIQTSQNFTWKQFWQIQNLKNWHLEHLGLYVKPI